MCRGHYDEPEGRHGGAAEVGGDVGAGELVAVVVAHWALEPEDVV